MDLAELVASLHSVRRTFGRAAAAQKRRLLRSCAERRLTSPRVVRDYHDLLLFFAAFPDDDDVRALVASEFDRIAAATRSLRERASGRSVLAGSGISGSVHEGSFTIDTVEWLAHRFPDDVELAWEAESLGPALDHFLSTCVSRLEYDGIIDHRLTTEQWMRVARGGSWPSDLAWLLAHLRRLRCAPEILDQVFDGLEIRVRWTLDDPSGSLTFVRFPRRPPYHHARSAPRRFSMRKLVDQPLPAPRKLTGRERDDLLHAARVALSVRERETDPVTHANPHDLTLFRLDRGIDVALYGMLPERRMPIESFVGYVAAKNGLPVAYGGAWVLLDRAEIGINVFDAFRGGESAYLFGQIMRVYRGHFGVRRLLVDPYQFGADNREGIRSGAFWFYYRFGFRPVDPALGATAREEWSRIRADRRYRTATATLKRLATSKLALRLGGAAQGEVPAPDLADLALAVTHAIGERFDGDRARAERWAARRAARVLGARATARWPEAERRAFERLSLLVALIPDLEEWTAAERRALLAVMRAKGGVRERDYVTRGQRHSRFREALRLLAKAGQDARAAAE